MKVLFVSSEIYPLAKTGGLADVSAGLPKALARLGVDIRLVLPGYPSALRVAAEQRPETKLDVPDAALTEVISARLPDSGLTLWLVDSPSLFRREGGLYQDLDGRDWGDNAQRFAHLTRVAARIAVGEVIPGWRADVVHCNDWHTGLLPLQLGHGGGSRLATLFTIHNLAFQGSRITHQKMVDTVLEMLPTLLHRDIQLALIGHGDVDAERALVSHAIANRAKMAVRIGYDERLAHRFYAAGDLLLHPSRFEGLAPLYAMCYGAVPIVRRVGGPLDNVVAATEDTIRNETATGFTFRDANASALLHCVDGALAAYARPPVCRRIQRQAMRHDSSWMASAQQYLSLYRVLAPSVTPHALQHPGGERRPAPMPVAATQLRRTHGIWKLISDARVSTRKTIAPASVRTGLGADAIRELFQPLVESLLTRDAYMLLADYHEYVEYQEPVSQAYSDRNAWTRMSVLNCARIGRFSSDRAIREYCREIWKVTPIVFDERRAGCGP